MNKHLRTTLIIIAAAAIVAAIGRSTPTNQVMPTHNYPMQVDTTDQLIIYDITDCKLDLACGQMPDTAREDIILCTAAAFTGKCLDYFEHTNILGAHISEGVLYDGYTENKDDIAYEQRYALFIWDGIDNQGQMLPKGIHNLPNTAALHKAVAQHGMAFTQHWVIKAGQQFSPSIQPLDRTESFRSICQKGKRYYVIESNGEMMYQSYLDALLAYGIQNALYMDMGTGWNHSFYRDASSTLHILHPKTHAYPTNWIVVYQ